ncbi:MAG: hypothetical protein GEU98_26945 [Pseudonocardiaceae bacterium]|nr:hypothetical protein [Pseudonocardiaceae bacterium]
MNTSAEAETKDRRPRLPSNIVVAALALLVVTAAFAAWFGISWWRAAADDSAELAQTRDDALRAGQSAIATFNTLDYRKPDEGFDRWEQASTGPAHDEIKKNRKTNKKQLQQAKAITTAKVLEGAVSELEADKGKATVLAAVEVSVRPQGQQASTKQIRLEAEMTRTNDGWKLSGIRQVEVAQPNQQGQQQGQQGQQGQPEGNGN